MPHLHKLTLNNIEFPHLIRHRWAFKLVLKRGRRVVIAGIHFHRIRHLQLILSSSYLAAMTTSKSHPPRIPHTITDRSRSSIIIILRQQKIIMGHQIWQIDLHQYQ